MSYKNPDKLKKKKPIVKKADQNSKINTKKATGRKPKNKKD